MDEDRLFGKLAYDTYCESMSFTSTITGKPLPKFNELEGRSQLAWCRVATEITNEFKRCSCISYIEKPKMRIS